MSFDNAFEMQEQISEPFLYFQLKSRKAISKSSQKRFPLCMIFFSKIVRSGY